MKYPYLTEKAKERFAYLHMMAIDCIEEEKIPVWPEWKAEMHELATFLLTQGVAVDLRPDVQRAIQMEIPG